MTAPVRIRKHPTVHPLAPCWRWHCHRCGGEDHYHTHDMALRTALRHRCRRRRARTAARRVGALSADVFGGLRSAAEWLNAHPELVWLTLPLLWILAITTHHP